MSNLPKRKALKIARISADLTQQELAGKIGVSQQTIAKWERGATTPALFASLRALEHELETPARVLFPDIFDALPVIS